ncbi:MAG TPA: double-strand break repair protein AddB [Alphaproteobacteria bacterium]|nr:double-strand break repair protein AddB [Alphaproteobacteria bacterium]
MTEVAAAPSDSRSVSLRHRPRVYSLPAGQPFLDRLAEGIWRDAGGDTIALARATVLLPNRRACRNLRDAFLRLTNGAPLLLPRLQPIGDIDDDEFVLTADEGGFDLPPAITPLERQLLLASLIMKRPDTGGDPAVATKLAEALANLLDSAQIEDVSLDRLDELVPAELAHHWQVTVDFLKIVREAWPKILAERGQMDPVARRVQLIRALAQRWAVQPPADLVYAAGSTGSIPATAELLGVVARLPTGKLVLPGLDLTLDEAAWDAIAGEPSHSQHGLWALLGSLGIKRSEIRAWHSAEVGQTTPRAAMLSSALRPAVTTDAWLDQPAPPDAAFAGLRRIEAATPQDEAGAIALVMRETLEQPGHTAALVTADRNLARRVVAELARWNIAVDDSAGTPLAHTPPGVFFRLVAQVIAERAAPAPLLALLKHPYAAGTYERAHFLRLARYLERRILRGPRLAGGFCSLVKAVTESRHADDLRVFVERLAAAAAPFEALIESNAAHAIDLLSEHVKLAEWLATRAGEPTDLWRGDAGEALANFVGEFRLSTGHLEKIDPRRWPALVDTLLAGRVVRPRYGSHPRLAIWGLLEARLQHADVIILGGLNEGTWPPEPEEDPWLSRPMRAQLGLSPPERRIGLTAHDFAQLAASPNVVLTRAAKIEGAPSVPSRWLLRLDAMLANDPRWKATRIVDYADWHRRLDLPVKIAPIEPPRPRPPVAARPRKLSVTQVETWVRDPYAIFARHILRLRPLEPVDADPGALERGLVIHQALDAFIRKFPKDLPPDALQHLLRCGEEAFRPLIDRPSVRAFWWPRFQRIAKWFIEEEFSRRADGIQPLGTELRGALTFMAAGGPFELRCIADRIDATADGSLIIIDYKTGQPPSDRQVNSGLSPQLPLEAAIALAGGFPGIIARGIAELAFVRLSGGMPPGEYRYVSPSQDGVRVPPEALAAAAREGLLKRIAQFDLERTPYLSRPRPQWLSRPGDYDHLARVKEWSQPAGDEA